VTRILIAPDKFKGTLTAQAAASAIAAGWSKARPDDILELLPMSDGGDGFGAVLGPLIGARIKNTPTVDAAHRPTQSPWWWEPKTKTAIIETAGIIGLAMLPAGKFHPFQMDSFGVGRLLQAAAKVKATKVIVGIGGSATNDGGFGVARALGWTFLDKHDIELKEWTRLPELAVASAPLRRLALDLTVAVDVENPLLGRGGCSRIYGPQKGLLRREFVLAEKCLARLSAVLREQNGIDCAEIPGAGAAGGLGFGLMAFAGARVESGFEIFARHARLDERIRQSDLVITGEGQMDRQTYMGKGVGQLARRCRELGVPCLGLAGVVVEPKRARQHFVHARALTELGTVRGAQEKAARLLQQLAENVARSWF
jgi:glycerate kinase